VREWDDRPAGADAMQRDAEGGFSVSVGLDAGRANRSWYRLDGQRWDNDWACDACVRNDFGNDFGGEDPVVDLTALPEAVPAAARRTQANKGAAKEAPPQTAGKTAR